MPKYTKQNKKWTDKNKIKKAKSNNEKTTEMNNQGGPNKMRMEKTDYKRWE